MARTMQLPPDKANVILEQLKTLRQANKQVHLANIQKLHSKLQFTAMALPCGKALLERFQGYVARKVLFLDIVLLSSVRATKIPKSNSVVALAPCNRYFDCAFLLTQAIA